MLSIGEERIFNPNTWNDFNLEIYHPKILYILVFVQFFIVASIPSVVSPWT
jgi:hypothetical protein